MNALIQYFNDSIEELRLVRWPTRRQAVKLSVIVLGFTAGCAIIFGFVDFILSEAVSALLNLAL